MVKTINSVQQQARRDAYLHPRPAWKHHMKVRALNLTIGVVRDKNNEL